MKRIDFPIRPYLLKYLQVHLKLTPRLDDATKLTDYVLSRSGQFGFALTAVLRKPAKSARHETSIEDCTAALGVDLKNFNHAYYDLTCGKLSAFAVFQYNDFVDDVFKRELYTWVRKMHERRSTIKDAIRSFMVFFDVTEDDIAFDTLRKAVQRNAGIIPRKKKKAKTKNFPVNLSQKTGGLSRKVGVLSQKTGVLSQKDTFAAVRQELSKLPLPLFEPGFFHVGA